MQEASKQIDELMDCFVGKAALRNRFEEKLDFVIPSDEVEDEEVKIHVVHLHGLIVEVMVVRDTVPSDSVSLDIWCPKFPADKSCKVRIETTIKNRLAQNDLRRCFHTVFSSKQQKSFYEHLISGEEYEDEKQGFLENGKLSLNKPWSFARIDWLKFRKRKHRRPSSSLRSLTLPIDKLD